MEMRLVPSAVAATLGGVAIGSAGIVYASRGGAGFGVWIAVTSLLLLTATVGLVRHRTRRPSS
jgi:hypothetical protein